MSVVSKRSVLLLVSLLSLVSSAASVSAQQSAAPHSDYGVSVALSGDGAKAESIFVSMLSHTRGDARALNNLGNLRLLKGEFGVALAFYERALRGDSLDAGIHLNRGIALMLMGDEARSTEATARGVQLAGGVDKANAMLGLQSDKGEVARADKKTMISPTEVKAMLARAAAGVPSTAPKSGRDEKSGAGETHSKSAWRSAGPRASDGAESATLLYWKR